MQKYVLSILSCSPLYQSQIYSRTFLIAFLSIQSIWPSYPPKRFSKAIQLYARDFESILGRMSPSRDQSECVAESKTFLERRLAEFLGQALRFHLRRLLNPPAISYTRQPESDSDDYDDAFRPSRPPAWKSQPQSRVHELIDLQLSETGRDSAVADGSVSSLFSLALSRIYEYIGSDAFESDSDPVPLPASFCQSPVSQRGLGTHKAPIKSMSRDEVKELICDIDDVYSFLGAYNACKFLLELIRAPGVVKEVHKMGGWSAMEQHAKMLRDLDLDHLHVEDSHFSLIGYAGTMGSFFAKVEHLMSYMEPKVCLAEISILALAKRYKTNKASSPTQRQAIFRKFPHVRIIAAAISEGKARSGPFPKVVPQPP